MAGLPKQPQVFAWIVLHNDGHLNFPLVILLDAFDDADLAGKSDIHDVAAASRAQADAGADSAIYSVDCDAVERRLVLQQLELPLVHCGASWLDGGVARRP